MKKLIVLLLLSGTVAADPARLLLPIVEIYDGDTIKTELSLPDPLHQISVRLRGVDTPEKPAASFATTGKLNRAKCVKEAEQAILAQSLVEILAEGTDVMYVSNYDYGKYGGRIIGDIEINGVDVATMLLEQGLAVPYDGGKKTYDWCS